MEARSSKRHVGIPEGEPQESGTVTREKNPPGSEQTHLKWKSSGRREREVPTTQAGGMAPAPQCSHTAWRTYESGSKWWMRCELCKGRLAEGAVQEQEGKKRLSGWVPYGWTGPRAPTMMSDLETGAWQCCLCKTQLPYGAAKVLTDVGEICMTCRSGTYEKRSATSASTASPSTTPAPKATATASGPAKTTEEGMYLNAEQAAFLEETLNARQWMQLLELESWVTSTVDLPEG